MGTPFAKWRVKGEPDPHGERYSGSIGETSMATTPCDILAEMLTRTGGQLSGIMILTAGKERLRWLSRKLYRLLEGDMYGINACDERRANTLLGHVTDDELANLFYLSEDHAGLRAGRHRMLWLLKEVKGAEERGPIHEIDFSKIEARVIKLHCPGRTTSIDSGFIAIEDNSLGESKRRNFGASKGVATGERPDGWYNQFNKRKTRK